ncbi:hypothetical protein [Alicyclobacillus sp. SO9]|uniref:hypothetical protein n=1 Tax=Alicyclobacillus sp. SO9 TaxID=2665646 RepID=UPI0018E8FB7B|nr:hypothetical protein [Alicyclobacillus sp. SO9]QQE79737.1 hypothetical protein GI364_04405 [Alicyclobacillus sp. SO9]
MSVLILNRLPHEEAPYEEWLRASNEDLILLTSFETESQYDTTRYAYMEGFTDYYSNEDVEIRARELFEQFRYHTVIALSELDLLRAAKLRSMLGIIGQQYESALAFRNKIVMKNLASKAGVAVPPFTALEGQMDLLEFRSKYGLPLVVKPICGSASEEVRVLENEEQLDSFYRRDLPQGMEVETFISGDMYHVDGLVLNNDLKFIWPSKYLNGCLAFKNQAYSGSYNLSKDHILFRRLVNFTNHLLNALPRPETFAFHAEIFHTPTDDLVLCEIASRAGGARLREIFKQNFNVDLNMYTVLGQCKIDRTLEITHGTLGGLVLIHPRRGRVRGIPLAPRYSWITEYKVYVDEGEIVSPAKLSIDRIASLVVQGNNESMVRDRLERSATWFMDSLVWEAEIKEKDSIR